ncbi:actin-related protein 10 isoform X2 [Callorhinchus milii]|uniref:actin-related protein 10 isoform X2 n=1 Tax=Callorhinchus milii TaxID=7868 RepID=UPI0004572E12|nr:actin-related protein 10 isoform X2 [Callorhinchus milii]|eukprot:gi/632951784/ref/XP_007891490.1/ PREDICTED: actin-related protein 10 isoform X2 [Callorhinchus milii]
MSVSDGSPAARAQLGGRSRRSPVVRARPPVPAPAPSPGRQLCHRMPLFEGLGTGGEKTAVVIDLGAAYTKCGFAGETGPRCIIPSEVKKQGMTQSVKVVEYNINTEELYGYLKEFIHMLYFRHLLVNPRDRRVVVIESVLCPSHFRETLTKVFFKHFEVPSVLFAPSHLMSLLTLGINSAVVLDCGYTEALALPIYEGIPILNAWGSLPLGGKAIHKELNSQLLEECTVDTGTETGQSLASVMSTLPDEILEDIKVRTCFVSDLQRGLKIQDAKFNIDGTAERPQPPPNVAYPLDGEKILHVKGSIRDSVIEILFEQDNEEKSVATLILDSLIQCPIDTRKQLAENLVVIGGTAMLPGFLHRLMAEIRYLVEKPKYREVLATKTFKIHTPPAKPNCVAWLGGAIFGALQDILGSRSVSKEYYSQTGRIPDWCCLSNPPLEMMHETKAPPPLMKRAYSTEK